MLNYLNQIPTVSKFWLIGSVLISTLVQVNVISPLNLYFSFHSAFINNQPWRILTTFFYFGDISIDLFLHLYFFVRYSRMLEEEQFASNKADYVWSLIVMSTMLLAMSPLINLPFLSSALSSALVYIWARSHPNAHIGLLVFIIRASYLPWAIVLLSWLITGRATAATTELAGIVVGHLWYFSKNIWPKELAAKGKPLLPTPRILTELLNN
ncbi:Der1-like protein [Wallemia mellicola]|nr:Der1-like protein [Wallemia mellicola]